MTFQTGGILDIVQLNGERRTYRIPIPINDSSTPMSWGRVAPDGAFSVSANPPRVAGVGLDGRRLWQLDNLQSSMPVISPDGKQIVLVSNERLVVYDVPSGQLKHLEFAGERPAWAPSGDRLAYDDGAKVYVHDLKRHVSTERGPGTEASWSADGNFLAVRMGSSRIDLIDLSTDQRRELFSYPSSSVPRWSPDGEWLAYTRRGGGKWWSIDWTGSEARQVMLRHVQTGAEASIAEIYKAHPDDFTWVTNPGLCHMK